MALKVLIIDDNPDHTNLMLSRMKKYGYMVSVENNPKRGLMRIANNDTDIALIDFLMPEMDGLQVLESFIKDKPFFPAILLTAFGSSTIAVEWMKKGGIDYIEKPIGSYDVLDLKIRLAVSKSILNQNYHQNKSWMLSSDLLSAFTESIKPNIQKIKSSLSKLKSEKYRETISGLEDCINSIDKIVTGAG